MSSTRTDLPALAEAILALRVPPASVTRAALRTESDEYRALLADIRDRAAGWARPGWAAAYAHSFSGVAMSDAERDAALAELLDVAHRKPRALQSTQATLLAELLIETRRTDELADLLARLPLAPRTLLRLRTDLANPWVDPSSTEEAWLDEVARLLGDLTPITLAPAEGAATPFDRLRGTAAPGSVHGELVTIVVSSFRPGPDLLTAVRSLIDQTWAELEILVVDDASGPEYAEIYARAEALDPRVRVITQEQNAGTYAARNRSIDEARGTYVTFHDSDDWAHPERIQRQVTRLADDPDVSAVRTTAFKMTEDLVLARRRNLNEMPGPPTLMFRREQVWPVLGAFDTVRKAADTEFQLRLESAIPGRLDDLAEPLLVMRMGAGSLSRDDFRHGWRHSARLVYQSAARSWHREIRAGSSPYLDRSGPRPFPSPRKFLARPQPAAPFDVVVLGDWRYDGARERDALTWIAKLSEAGQRVGIIQVEGINFDSGSPVELLRPAQRLVATGAVEHVPWDERITAAAAVAVDPAVLSFLPRTEPGLRTNRMVVLTDRAPRTPEAPLATYDPQHVARAAARFGAEVLWSPRGGGVSAPDGAVTTETRLPAAFASPETVTIRTADRVTAVIVLDDDVAALEATAAAVRVLLDDGRDVRMRLNTHQRRVLVPAFDGATTSPVLFAPEDITVHQLLASATDAVVLGAATPTPYHRIAAECAALGVDLRTPTDVPAAEPVPVDEAAALKAWVTEITADA
ncbi:glycosyltransferase family 2 protein [Myceligenerans xiligouense]|uniref:Glycosyl transferase family 2 n=1 Tax=Myceligenerans xiligouense TaxID=253184 RepID=A0A3N4YJ59_9MICO|nr:glycosyltransferase family 2 protein [Myceligenerans xiligouense]RPF20137.1 glycosyl transferase family 2 [Myceligenerans xiligouense]